MKLETQKEVDCFQLFFIFLAGDPGEKYFLSDDPGETLFTQVLNFKLMNQYQVL